MIGDCTSRSVPSCSDEIEQLDRAFQISLSAKQSHFAIPPRGENPVAYSIADRRLANLHSFGHGLSANGVADVRYS